jgi:hypothetical protein
MLKGRTSAMRAARKQADSVHERADRYADAWERCSPRVVATRRPASRERFPSAAIEVAIGALGRPRCIMIAVIFDESNF